MKRLKVVRWGEMEGDSESERQSKVAAGGRAGIGNPQSHHQETPESGGPSNTVTPDGSCEVII